eukprot:650224-Pelagomonas_calceolata.AAC.1
MEGRTLACVDVWIEYVGEATFVLCLERVHLLGGLLWSSVAPVCVVLVLGGLAVGAGPGMTVVVRGRRRP